jgi:hypothetical protein
MFNYQCTMINKELDRSLYIGRSTFLIDLLLLPSSFRVNP